MIEQRRRKSKSDASTYQGGVERVLRRIERDQISDVWVLRDWLYEMHDIPLSERTAFWAGMDSALSDAIACHPDAIEGGD